MPPNQKPRAYELPDGTPSYWDKNNPEPARQSLKRTGQDIGEKIRNYEGKLVSGKIFRMRAGITYKTFISLIRRRELVPICRNDANYALFAEEDIARIRQDQQASLGIISKRRGMIEEQCEYTSEEAYSIISRLKAGLNMQDIFLETQGQIHPVIIQSILRDWAHMKEGMWLSKEDLDRINDLPLEGSFPLKTASELYEVLLTASKEKICGQCGRRPPCGTCLSCAKKSLYKARKANKMRTEGVPYEAEGETYQSDQPSLEESD